MEMTARELLVHLYQTALDAVDGRQLVHQWCLGNKQTSFDYCVAIGKAAPAMLQGALDGNSIKQALLICPPMIADRSLRRDKKVQLIESAHPVPDERSIESGQALIRFLSNLPEGSRLLILISGGTSSLVELPDENISLEQLQDIYRYLLASGKNIHNINTWRKRFSRIKGGGLLQYVKHVDCTQLLLSDVRDDALADIGSGLLVVNDDEVDDDTWLHQQSKQPAAVIHNDEAMVDSHVIGNLEMAKQVIAEEVQHLGFDCHAHDEFIEGEAIEQGERLAQWLLEAEPGIHVWGGETTVTLPDNPGLGGRNQTLALSAARYFDQQPALAMLAAGTDGIDGNTPCAGAVVTSATMNAVRQTGYDAEQELARANAGVVLMATGDLIKTGPSNTNVMDLIIALKQA